MKKLVKYISDLFHLVGNVRQLEYDMHNKVIASEKVSSVFSSMIFASHAYGIWDDEYKPITLEEKVNVLSEMLNVRFERQSKEEKVVAVKKVVRKKVEKKRKKHEKHR